MDCVGNIKIAKREDNYLDKLPTSAELAESDPKGRDARMKKVYAQIDKHRIHTLNKLAKG